MRSAHHTNGRLDRDPRDDRAERAARHAALGDRVRLHIVEELWATDRTPSELGQTLGLASNLLAHHLEVLETVGLISRQASSGDGRRRYLRLHHEALSGLVRPGSPSPSALARRRALFVCTANSARSQLAAALWTQLTSASARSAGTHPARRVHPGAASAARRVGLDLSAATPRRLDDVAPFPSLVVTVCDRAHEELVPGPDWLHWSVPDPVPLGTRAAFDAALRDLRDRIETLVAS